MNSGTRSCAGVRRSPERSDVAIHVPQGAECALLLSREQGDPDRAARFYVERPQDSHRFHDDHDAGAVVGRARSGCPAVEMRHRHYDFIPVRRIDARESRRAR
jgi:hypothetical protein